MLAVRSLLSLVPPGAVAVCACLAFAPPNTIPMGEASLGAATTKLGEIDPAALPTSGPDAAGKLCNKVPGGVLINDLTFSIKKGNAGSVEVEGVANGQPFNSQGSAHVTGLSMGGNVCLGDTIKSLTGDGSGDDLVCKVTPSYGATVDGVQHEFNALPAYELSAMNDMARNGSAEVYHAGVLLLVFNKDGEQSLSALSGSLSLPAGVNASIASVHLRESDGDPLTPVQSSHTSTGFELSGFPALKSGASCQVLVLLNAPLDGKPLRAAVTGVFTAP